MKNGNKLLLILLVHTHVGETIKRTSEYYLEVISFDIDKNKNISFDVQTVQKKKNKTIRDSFFHS